MTLVANAKCVVSLRAHICWRPIFVAKYVQREGEKDFPANSRPSQAAGVTGNTQGQQKQGPGPGSSAGHLCSSFDESPSQRLRKTKSQLG